VAAEIELADRANKALLAIERRWIREHGSADNPLLAEIQHAANRLREMPELGRVCGRDRRGREIRQILLRLDWHLYYTHRRVLNVITILSVRYARRGTRPGFLQRADRDS
jgi:plasmid stabilization system protein ParE